MNVPAQRQLATDVGFSEGPVIRADGEIVFVSIDQGRLHRIVDGKLSVLAELPGGPNGATEGADGLIYVTQTGGRWGARNKHPDWSLVSGVQAVDRGGRVRWISTDPIAPNDLCFGPDGWLWLTDPSRYREPRDDGRLFRVNVQTGETDLLCTVPWAPNGIGFGLEEDALYVAKAPDYEIVRFSIDGGRLRRPETFAKTGHYSPDGFLFDTAGNLTLAAVSHGAGPGQIQTYDRNGKLTDVFSPGANRVYTNVALSPDRTLVVTAAEPGHVLAVDNWPYAGLPLYPFRSLT